VNAGIHAGFLGLVESLCLSQQRSAWQSVLDGTLLHEIFGAARSCRFTRTEVREGGVFIAVEPLDQRLLCPECGSQTAIRKGNRTRRVPTLPIGFDPVCLEAPGPRGLSLTAQTLIETAAA